MRQPEPIITFPAQKRQAQRRVHFSKSEISCIMLVYGRMVAAGIWRDYAIGDAGPADSGAVAFSVFHRACEFPAYRIVKEPRLAGRQGAWAVIGRQGRILKRGNSLENILRIFDGKALRLVK